MACQIRNLLANYVEAINFISRNRTPDLGVALFGISLTPEKFMPHNVRQEKREFCFTV
jgi:hypothetical protein